MWPRLKPPPRGPKTGVVSTQEGFPLFMPMSYEQYRQSPQWRGIRAAALLRAGTRCALNARHTEGLDVLHNTRERLGAERDCDLVVLCERCQVLMRQALSPEAGDHLVAHAVPVRRVMAGGAGANRAAPAFGASSGSRGWTRRQPA